MSRSLRFLFAFAIIAITAALYWPSLHYAPFLMMRTTSCVGGFSMFS